MRVKFFYIIGVLVITFVLSSCDFFDDDKSDDDPEANVAKAGYLRVIAWDLTPAQKFIVWVYPDDTAFSSMYGNSMFSNLIAEAKISLNSFGEGMTAAVYPNTGETVSLKGWYALFAFIDTNSNGEPDTGEKYAIKDVNVNGETEVQFDDFEVVDVMP